MTLWLTKRWNRFGTIDTKTHLWQAWLLGSSDTSQRPTRTGSFLRFGTLRSYARRLFCMPSWNWQWLVPKDRLERCTFGQYINVYKCVHCQEELFTLLCRRSSENAPMRMGGRSLPQANWMIQRNDPSWIQGSAYDLLVPAKKGSPKQSLPCGKLKVCYGRHDPFTDELPIQLLFSIAVF